MAVDKKNLVVAFVHFLKAEISSGDLDEEAVEGLEVAMQCLESAYDIEGQVPHPETDLLKIYQKHSPQICQSTATTPISDIDKKAAEEEKLRGNNFMKEEKYADAIECYTKAIQVDGKNAIYYCNRAAAYTKLENNTQAISDCKEALRIDPSYGKAHSRMGLAHLAEKDYVKAAECYEKALTFEPENSSYKSNLNIARDHVSKQQQQQPSQNPGNNPLSGLDINSLLSNPAVMNMAQNFMQNPAMQNMFQNFMGGMGGPPPPSGNETNETDEDTLTRESQQQQSDPQQQTNNPMMPGGFQLPSGMDFGNIMNATQQVAAQLREQNPELADSLRQQFQQGQQQPPQDGDEKQ